MTGLELAILALRHAVESPRRHHPWRWLVRHRMSGVHDVLAAETSRGGDAWLAARETTLRRERDTLVRRLGDLGTEVLRAPDVEALRPALARLLTDLEHHRQRLTDLVYDSVSLEIGGSE